MNEMLEFFEDRLDRALRLGVKAKQEANYDKANYFSGEASAFTTVLAFLKATKELQERKHETK